MRLAAFFKDIFRSKTALIAVLSFVALYALCLRVWDLGEQSLWMDEGFTINASLSVEEKGIPVLDSGKMYWNGSLYVYAAAISQRVFGLDPFSPWPSRLPAALFGTALAFATFALARKLFPEEGQLSILVLALSVFSLWAIAWSRQARGYTAAALFIMLAFWLLSRYLESRKVKEASFAAVSFFLGLASHISVIAFLPAFIALLIRPRLAKAASLSLVKHSLFGPLLVCAAIGAASIPFIGLSNHVPAYLSFFSQELSFSIFYWGGIAAIALSLFDKARLKTLSFFSIPFISSLVFILFFGKREEHRYLFTILPFSIILFAYAAYRVIELALPASERKAILACVLALAIAYPSLAFIPRSFYGLEMGSPQPDFKTAFRHIRENMREGDSVISSFPHLHKIYLGQKGIWLAESLTGDPTEVGRKTVDGKDYYVGAPVISSADSFKEFLRSHAGFVLFDGTTFPRSEDYHYALLGSGKAIKVLELSRPARSKVWLYRF
jgi:hypothetical protein